MDGAGINREIEMIAELWHHAPVLGGKAHAVLAAHEMLRIEIGELVRTLQRHEVGETVALLFVEGAPVLGGADDLGGRNASQTLTGSVPDHDATLRIDHEGGDDQML